MVLLHIVHGRRTLLIPVSLLNEFSADLKIYVNIIRPSIWDDFFLTHIMTCKATFRCPFALALEFAMPKTEG